MVVDEVKLAAASVSDAEELVSDAAKSLIDGVKLLSEDVADVSDAEEYVKLPYVPVNDPSPGSFAIIPVLPVPPTT